MTGVLLFETRQVVAEAGQGRRGVGHALSVDPVPECVATVVR